jgi:hypothetical protein
VRLRPVAPRALALPLPADVVPRAVPDAQRRAPVPAADAAALPAAAVLAAVSPAAAGPAEASPAAADRAAASARLLQAAVLGAAADAAAVLVVASGAAASPAAAHPAAVPERRLRVAASRDVQAVPAEVHSTQARQQRAASVPVAGERPAAATAAWRQALLPEQPAPLRVLQQVLRRERQEQRRPARRPAAECRAAHVRPCPAVAAAAN